MNEALKRIDEEESALEARYTRISEGVDVESISSTPNVPKLEELGSKVDEVVWKSIDPKKGLELTKEHFFMQSL